MYNYQLAASAYLILFIQNNSLFVSVDFYWNKHKYNIDTSMHFWRTVLLPLVGFTSQTLKLLSFQNWDTWSSLQVLYSLALDSKSLIHP